MINQNERERLIVHLDKIVDSAFRILPLYEERLEGKDVFVEVYVESLLFGLYGLQNVIDIKYSHDYLSLLSILESIKVEINSENNKHSIVKREVFKCIDIIKNMISKIQADGD